MVLPASGQISFDDIRIELQVGSQGSFNLESASLGVYTPLNECGYFPSSTNPDSIDEWYNYCHNCTASLYIRGDYSATSCNDACTSTPFVPCLIDVLNTGSVYHLEALCGNPATGYWATYSGGTACTGTKVGQTCYYFNNASLVSTETCTTTTTTTTTTCAPFGTFLRCDGTTAYFADGICGEYACFDNDACGGSSSC